MVWLTRVCAETHCSNCAETHCSRWSSSTEGDGSRNKEDSASKRNSTL